MSGGLINDYIPRWIGCSGETVTCNAAWLQTVMCEDRIPSWTIIVCLSWKRLRCTWHVQPWASAAHQYRSRSSTVDFHTLYFHGTIRAGGKTPRTPRSGEPHVCSGPHVTWSCIVACKHTKNTFLVNVPLKLLPPEAFSAQNALNIVWRPGSGFLTSTVGFPLTTSQP